MLMRKILNTEVYMDALYKSLQNIILMNWDRFCIDSGWEIQTNFEKRKDKNLTQSDRMSENWVVIFLLIHS